MEKKFFVRGVNSGIYYAEIVKRKGTTQALSLRK